MNFTPLLIGAFLLLILANLAAYNTGITRGNRALAQARTIRTDTVNWITENWATEQDAYNRGLIDGLNTPIHASGCRPELPDHDHDTYSGEPMCADCGNFLDRDTVCGDCPRWPYSQVTP